MASSEVVENHRLGSCGYGKTRDAAHQSENSDCEARDILDFHEA